MPIKLTKKPLARDRYLKADPAHKITTAKVKRIIRTVDKGLTVGMGMEVPGRMCVEAAVCYGMGYEHGDEPKCVEESIRDIKITINDLDGWPTNAARAAGLRKLAIAQLGSEGTVDPIDFSKKLYERVTQKFVAYLLNRLAEQTDEARAKERLKYTAKRAGKVTDNRSRRIQNFLLIAELLVKDVRTAYTDEASLKYRLFAAVHAVLYNLRSVPNAYAIAHAIEVFERDSIKLHTKKEHHKMLLLICDVILQALKDVKSPGCKWLYLLEK